LGFGAKKFRIQGISSGTAGDPGQRDPDGTEPDAPLSRTKPPTALESDTVSFARLKKGRV